VKKKKGSFCVCVFSNSGFVLKPCDPLILNLSWSITLLVRLLSGEIVQVLCSSSCPALSIGFKKARAIVKACLWTFHSGFLPNIYLVSTKRGLYISPSSSMSWLQTPKGDICPLILLEAKIPWGKWVGRFQECSPDEGCQGLGVRFMVLRPDCTVVTCTT
jgi:hypothetical protein